MDELIYKSVSGTPYDIALVFYSLWKHVFKFFVQQNGKQLWYHYCESEKNWKPCPSGSKIRLKMSTDFYDEYMKMYYHYYKKSIENIDRTQYQNISKNFLDIAKKLKCPHFKATLEQELKDLYTTHEL